MRRSVSLLAVTAVIVAGVGGALGTAHAASTTDPGAPPSIIGGETVSSAPWIATTLYNGYPYCSASFIAARFVMTATHCLGGTMSVRVGSVYNASGGTVANVTRTHTRFDIALLELDRSIDGPTMPLASTNPPIGSTNSIYGWGQTCLSGCDLSPQLKTATVRFQRVALDAEGGELLNSARISGVAWYGDSGGPQLYNGEQVGVASSSNGVNDQNYSSVANSREWIRSIAGV